MIRYENELTDPEREYMTTILPSLRGTRAKRCLQTHFPTKEFADSLIQRMIKKGKIALFGKDEDAINQFMDLGKLLTASGGQFFCSHDESIRINEIHLQTATMAQYADIYKDFNIVDGTFSISAYDMMLIVTTNVDCLGKSDMTGYIFAESETSEAVVRGLKTFKLDRAGATLMSDGAPAYALAAQTSDMHHVLCVQHYRTALLSARKGMTEPIGNQFLKDCNDLP
jgi:hypothetical protein